jgi:hypothetical protein
MRTTGSRRIYGLHHRAIPTKPLAFTSVALRDAPATSLPSILSSRSGSGYSTPSSACAGAAQNVLEASDPRIAVFYSLCATQPVRATRFKQGFRLSTFLTVKL